MYYGNSAQAKLLAGVNKVADMVATTMGPGGKTVFYTRGRNPQSTKDGVTVAKYFVLEDKFEQNGVELIIEAARKTVRLVGDGTTTTTVMARAMMLESFQRMQLKKPNPHLIISNLKEFAALAEASIKSQTMPADDDALLKAGTISANGDVEIAKLCLDVIKQVGADPANITLKDDEYADKDTFTLTKGMVLKARVDPAVLGPFTYSTISNVKDGGRVAVIIVDMLDTEISYTNHWHALFKQLSDQGHGVLVVGKEFAKNMKTFLIQDRERFQTGFIVPNLHGGKWLQLARDLQIMTKAQEIKLNDELTIKVGFCDSIQILPDMMTLINPAGENSPEHLNLITEVQEMVSQESNSGRRQLLKERLARLTKGMAIIKVTGESEIDLLERKDRFDDCLRAICTASETGVVRGGGSSFLDAAYSLLEESVDPLYQERKAAQDILISALVAPYNQITVNSLGYNPRIDGRKLTKHKELTIDAYTGEFINAIEKGIIDPAGVQQQALKSAVNAACIFIATGGMYAGTNELF